MWFNSFRVGLRIFKFEVAVLSLLTPTYTKLNGVASYLRRPGEYVIYPVGVSALRAVITRTA